jgi:[acyl-carrier-protein] S-malonyltransferase
MKLAAIFPGQGAQSVGMLADIAQVYPSVKVKFEVASEVLGFDLWSMVQDGPGELLGSTENTQPALLAASVALWELWPQGAEKIDVMAGHSLGEYSALVCAGSIGFEDAIRLVRHRGELMQRAVPNGQGGMAAILGLDDRDIEACCASVSGEVGAANYNAPGQVVIAGEMSALDEAIEACKAAGAKRAIKLDVSGPFHCKLMAATADDFSKTLNEIEMVMPQIPVLQNVYASIAKDTEELKRNLVEQLYCPVQWTASVQALLLQGLESCVECGPGNVLAGLVKRISRETQTIGLSKIAGIQALGDL